MAALAIGCTSGEEDLTEVGLVAEPLQYEAVQSETLMAQLAPDATGVRAGNTLSEPNQIKYLYNGAGVAAGDIDGDGLNDLYVVSEEGPNALYHNLGDMRFEEITDAAGVAGPTDSTTLSVGAQFGDVDNDGDLDLFVTNWRGSNQLFRNEGDLTFTDVTTEAGLSYVGGSTTPTFADTDRDGDLDLFVATYRPVALQYEQDSLTLQRVGDELQVPTELADRVAMVGGQLRELGERDLFYRNTGDGTFELASDEVGIVGTDWGLSSTFADFDGDLWPDLYVTNDFWSPDRFYHNQGDGTFETIAHEMVQYTPMFSMGIDFGDVNNDGHVDFFIGDMLSREHTLHQTQHGMMDEGPMGMEHALDEAPQLMRNGLYVNNGDGSFSEVAFMADVAATEWTWTTKFADMDLDGYLDLLITNGMVRDMMDSDYTERTKELNRTADRETILAFLNEYPPLVTRNLAFRNVGGLEFEDVSADWGFDLEAISYGASVSDLDGDGDLDAVVNNINLPATVYRNDAAGPRVHVRLVGSQSNRFGVGARVTLAAGGIQQVRELSTSGGYLSGHAPELTFGLPTEARSIESLQVEWPSGHSQTFTLDDTPDLQPDHRFIVTEPSDAPPPTPSSPDDAEMERAMFQPASPSGLAYTHQERAFDDFAEQDLLPRMLSTLGPGVAWGDPDRDGDDDLYVAGAGGQTGGFFRNDGGTFEDMTTLAGIESATRDEMAPLWWPSRDGQTSLLVAMSTVEGQGPVGKRIDFAEGLEASGADWAPRGDSGASLAASDFDNDGDLDVFLGSRARPGEWPLPASSRLFENRDGELADVTAEKAPDLESVGLVTAALWSDVDLDGDADLILATELGPVRLLRNENGRLVEATAEAGLAEATGLWNGVNAGDFDGDGDFDLIATNIGLNTKYKASPEKPLVVYAGNVDGDGDIEVVETVWVGDTLYPARERGATGAAMPFVLDEFRTYLSFAKASLDDVYGNRLDDVSRLEATTLAHSVFLNDGSGRFEVQPLPRESQVSAAFGVAVSDFDLDGLLDAYLAMNFMGADHETMAYGAGPSVLLKGDGAGGFAATGVETSGIFLPEEGRGAAVADYDSDGDPDLAVGVSNGALRLFANQAPTSRSLRVRLAGPAANPCGVGARVSVSGAKDSLGTREVRAGGGYLSQDSCTQFFGLGSEAGPVSVHVTWPDGTTTNIDDARGGMLVEVERE